MISTLPSALVLLLLASRALSSPVAFRDLGRRESQRDVAFADFAPSVLIDYSAPVTFPTLGFVFQSGGPGYAEWSQTLPTGLNTTSVSGTANLVLGYTSTLSEGLHYNISQPLGVKIPLYTSTNRFNFTFPANLPTRTTYVLSLQGSSGNISPEFTIVGAEGSDTTVGLTTTLPASSTTRSIAFSPVGGAVTATSVDITSTGSSSDTTSSTPVSSTPTSSTRTLPATTAAGIPAAAASQVVTTSGAVRSISEATASTVLGVVLVYTLLF